MSIVKRVQTLGFTSLNQKEREEIKTLLRKGKIRFRTVGPELVLQEVDNESEIIPELITLLSRLGIVLVDPL